MSEDKARDARKCIEVGETAMAAENFEKAKRLLLKAERLSPSERAKELLDQIEASNKQENNNQDENNAITAEKCLTIARIAIATKDFEKAEKFLLKSIRFYPLAEATVMLNSIKDADKIDSADLIKAAKKAHLKQDYDKALSIIDKLELLSNNTKLDVITRMRKIVMDAKDGNSTGNYHLWDNIENGSDTEKRKPVGTLENAEECIDKAQIAFNQNENKKALRLLLKAERIYSTFRAKDLLDQVREKMTLMGENPDEVRVILKPAAKKCKTPPPPPPPKKREVTSEQLSEIQRVKRAGNDYDVLNVPRGCSVDAVKKAYKSLTKVLHPDKNKAPGAKEAFMRVKEAADNLKKKR